MCGDAWYYDSKEKEMKRRVPFPPLTLKERVMDVVDELRYRVTRLVGRLK